MCSNLKYYDHGGRDEVTLLNPGGSHFVPCTYLFISDFNWCFLHSLLSFHITLKVIPLHNHYVRCLFSTFIHVSPPLFLLPFTHKFTV